MWLWFLWKVFLDIPFKVTVKGECRANSRFYSVLNFQNVIWGKNLTGLVISLIKYQFSSVQQSEAALSSVSARMGDSFAELIARFQSGGPFLIRSGRVQPPGKASRPGICLHGNQSTSRSSSNLFRVEPELAKWANCFISSINENTLTSH